MAYNVLDAGTTAQIDVFLRNRFNEDYNVHRKGNAGTAMAEANKSNETSVRNGIDNEVESGEAEESQNDQSQAFRGTTDSDGKPILAIHQIMATSRIDHFQKPLQ